MLKFCEDVEFIYLPYMSNSAELLKFELDRNWK